MKTLITISLKIWLLISLLTLGSCDMFDPNQQLIGRYSLRHNKFGKCICYRVDDSGSCLELISGEFGPIGVEDNYIIVEKSPYQYLIITVYKKLNYFPEKGISGPFSLAEFNKQKQKLHIKADFNINTN